MKKLLILTLLGASSLFLSVKVAASETDYSEVEGLFKNINEMTSAYEEVHNEEWNATKITEITDVYDEEDNKIGYLVIFDEGYVAYSNELSVLKVSTTEYPSFYRQKSFDKKVVYIDGKFVGDDEPTTIDNDATNIFYSLKSYYQVEGFNMISSMVQIPYFKDHYDSSEWGNYQGITFTYGGENSGAILATMSLMYTLKVNGGVDLTPAKTSYTAFKDQLYIYTNFDFDDNPFMFPSHLHTGINHYLTNNFGDKYTFSAVTLENLNVPAITRYINNNPYSANYCMRIGYSSINTWWIFKDYYDIVMANSSNFFIDEYDAPDMWVEELLSPYYIVKQDYREEMFQFFEGNTLLK